MTTNIGSGSNFKGRLLPGQPLAVNQPLVSSNGKYQLVLQDDCNLVIRMDSQSVWASNTGILDPRRRQELVVVLHDDGDLALHTPSPAGTTNWSEKWAFWSLLQARGKKAWDGLPPRKSEADRPALIMQDDGNLVISIAGKTVWHSYTAPRTIEKKTGNGNPTWLYTNETLSGEDRLLSQNGKFEVRVTTGGVELRWAAYETNLWTAGGGAGNWVGSLTLLTNGELKVKTTFGDEKWVSGTAERGDGNSILTVEDTGNLTITSDGKQIWATNTAVFKDPVAPSKPPRYKSPSNPDRLKCGESLGLRKTLSSPNGQYQLMYREDGNLVLVDATKKTIWQTKLNNSTVAEDVFLQNDDNLVIQPEGMPAQWSSNTYQKTGGGTAQLIVEDRGVAVIKSNNLVRWSTNPDLVQTDLSQYTLVPPDSDRVRPRQYLPAGQVLLAPNRQFRAYIQPDGALVVQHSSTGTITTTLLRSGDKKASKIVVDPGSRLATYTSDDILTWQGKLRNPGDCDLIMRNDGVLSFWKEGSDPKSDGRPWSNVFVFPLYIGPTNSLAPGSCFVKGQMLTAGNYQLSLETNGTLKVSNTTNGSQKYYYLQPNRHSSVTSATFARFNSLGYIEILDDKFNSILRNQRLMERETTANAAFTLASDGSFTAVEARNWMTWDSKTAPSGDSPNPPPPTRRS